MNQLITFIDKSLPPTVGSTTLTFKEEQNMLVTPANTSLAGNTYFKGIRLSNRIFISFEIGIGWFHTFVNSVTVHSNQDNERKIIGTIPYHNERYDEDLIKNAAKTIVRDKLVCEASIENIILDENWLKNFINDLIDDAYNNQIETLKKMQFNKLLNK